MKPYTIRYSFSGCIVLSLLSIQATVRGFASTQVNRRVKGRLIMIPHLENMWLVSATLYSRVTCV